MEIFTMFVQLILALSITLGLMLVTFKVIGTKVNRLNDNKYVKVIERVQATKENSILVVRIGKKGYVMTSGAGHMEKVFELSEDEINKIEDDKKKVAQDMNKTYNDFISKYKKNIFKIVKNIKSKDEKYDK